MIKLINIETFFPIGDKLIEIASSIAKSVDIISEIEAEVVNRLPDRDPELEKRFAKLAEIYNNIVKNANEVLDVLILAGAPIEDLPFKKDNIFEAENSA